MNVCLSVSECVERECVSAHARTCVCGACVCLCECGDRVLSVCGGSRKSVIAWERERMCE